MSGCQSCIQQQVKNPKTYSRKTTRRHKNKRNNQSQRQSPCGQWSNLQPMIRAREKFAMASGPDVNGTVVGVDQDPRVYVCGGLDKNGNRLRQCEKYDPNTDSWSNITPLPRPLGNCDATFAPDYGVTTTETLGYIYVVGDNVPILFRYNIRQNEWEQFRLPFAVSNASIQYLDDIGGPLASLFIAISNIELPACTDSQTLWIVGGDGTEQQSWYIESNIQGQLVGEWIRGPDLPLLRRNPEVGRVFWRDAGITSFGVSNCASIAVCGGSDKERKVRRQVQLLVRNQQCNWQWISALSDNPTNIPNDVLTMALPVTKGAFGAEQWPETLVTGGRAIVFGGIPASRNQKDNGTTQFAQLRFTGGRYQRDPRLSSNGQPGDSAWNITTNMPNQRIYFRAAPLSQENSSRFDGARVSRFLVGGGRDIEQNQVTNRVQLFQLPVPPISLSVGENINI